MAKEVKNPKTAEAPQKATTEITTTVDTAPVEPSKEVTEEIVAEFKKVVANALEKAGVELTIEDKQLSDEELKEKFVVGAILHEIGKGLHNKKAEMAFIHRNAGYYASRHYAHNQNIIDEAYEYAGKLYDKGVEYFEKRFALPTEEEEEEEDYNEAEAENE